MNQEQANKWKTLLHFLRTKVPPENFNIECILNAPYEENWFKVYSSHDCGSAACGIGYMPIALPEDFRYIKLQYEYVGFVEESYRRVGMSSLAEFFGLDKLDIEYTFYNVSNTTPEKLANAMEKVLHSQGWE